MFDLDVKATSDIAKCGQFFQSVGDSIQTSEKFENVATDTDDITGREFHAGQSDRSHQGMLNLPCRLLAHSGSKGGSGRSVSLSVYQNSFFSCGYGIPW